MIRRVLLALALMAAPVSADEIPPQPEGKPIWDAEAQAWITEDALYDQLAGEDLIVIGERHGTPEHHEIEARILYELAERGHYPALALEMLRPEQMATLTAYRAENPEYSDALGVALEWWDTGWPSFNHYAPVFQAAFALKLQIVAADLNPESAGAFFDRFESTSDKEKFEKFWRAKISIDHCDTLSEHQLAVLIRYNVGKDLHIANTINRKNDLTIAIIGARHAQSISAGKSIYLTKQTAAGFFFFNNAANTRRLKRYCE